MNTLTQGEQDEQTLSVFDLQDELDAMRQAIMDYEELESERLWEEYMEIARQQTTPSDSEEETEEEKPTQLIGRKRRYSEMEKSEEEEDDEEQEFCQQDCGCALCEEGFSDDESEYDEEGVGKCGFRCDDRCRICEDGGFDSRDET